MWEWHGYGFGGGFVMGLMMLVFWGLVIWFVVGFVRGQRGDGPEARSVLDERFARGEIDAAEYRERLAVLDDAARAR